MRYDNWDVILFPRDSLVPIQEFRTACYASHDEQGRNLPTLTCYISSLPTSTPFRISVHSWGPPAKPSALIESRRKTNQRVVYATQVIVDGARVFHGLYEITSKWPQEIVNEKRSITYPEQQSSHRGPFLEFPPFHQNVLMQSSWDARENSGRIKVLLSEQLIRKTNNPGELDLGASHDIVCFAFQHAPRDILEQAGISWPIRNPLYLASTSNPRQLPIHIPPTYPRSRDSAAEARPQSPLSYHSAFSFARTQNPDLHPRSRTNPPHSSQFPKPPAAGGKPPRAAMWDGSGADSFGDIFDNMSMDTWSTKRTTSHSTADISMTDFMYNSASFTDATDAWNPSTTRYGQDPGKNWGGSETRSERKARQAAIVPGDVQFGQLVGTASPPKKPRDRVEYNQEHHSKCIAQAPVPRMAGMPVPAHASPAALARRVSYQDFHPHLRSGLDKHSPDKGDPDVSTIELPSMYHPSFASDKENRPPSQPQDSRLPTPYPLANRVPTPHPFVPQMGGWDTNASMRDPSSVFSSLSRFDRQQQVSQEGKSSPVPLPSAGGSIRSRKEGPSMNSPALPPDHSMRHDKSLLPAAMDTMHSTAKVHHQQVPHNTPITTSPTRIEDLINHDSSATDNRAYVPGHKSGMSSIDSTVQLERQLFSALGEELSFGANLDATAGMDGGAALPGMEDVETPLAKRKRRETFGAERGKSPVTKMVRDDNGVEELGRRAEMPHLRGGD